MRRIATPVLLLALAATVAQAQPVRNGQDVMWARDVAGAAITHDGALNEAAWAQAESIPLVYNGTMRIPGGGWDDQGTFGIPSPTDPPNASMKVLRDGNTLWVGITAQDKSVGGTRDFFVMDGVVFSVVDKRNRETILPDDTTPFRPNNFTGSMTDEFFYSWMDRSVPEGELPPPGSMPVHFGNHADDRALWEGMTVVNGVTNQDTTATGQPIDDVGYTMEIRIDVSTLGFDYTQAGGDALWMTLGLYDIDYRWSDDLTNLYRTRAWFQNPWGGDMPNGTARIFGAPGVTVASGAVPEITEPDVRIAGILGAPTLDGCLSEPFWSTTEPQVTLKYQMSTDMMDALPGIGPWYTHWFRPGSSETVPVVDASTGTFKMFYHENTLYVGMQSDDQAISGQILNGDYIDGFRFILRDLAPEEAENYVLGRAYPAESYRIAVDSTGQARVLNDAIGVVTAAACLGTSTAGDPTDIDSGYSIEIAIPLEPLGFDPNGTRTIHFGIDYYDGDNLDNPDNSTATRTWLFSEVSSGPHASMFLDPNLIVSTAGTPGEAAALRTLGAMPNPASGSVSLRYELPHAAEATIEVYDVLGRLVRTVKPGLQEAGAHAVPMDVRAFSAGSYVYRVQIDGAVATGRLVVTR
jgi:hypothetical protein